MKKFIVFYFISQLTFLTGCKLEEVTISEKEEVNISKEGEASQISVPKTSLKNLISKYSFQATFDGNPLREFELIFSYDEKGTLETIKRTNKTYNLNTGLVSSEGFTNWTIKYNAKGFPSQVSTFNDKSLAQNTSSIMSYIYENNNLLTVNQAVIKDEKQILSLERYKLNYNQSNQLISYSSGYDKGHDFTYVSDMHESSLLKGVSSFDFEYGSNFNPTADYEDGLKFVIFQALEADPAIGFGLVSQKLPTKLINKTGGFSVFETISNQENFPIKIVEKIFNKGNIYSKHTYTTNIEYKKFIK